MHEKAGERRKGLQTIRIIRTRLRIRFHLITIVLSIEVFEGKRRIKGKRKCTKISPRQYKTWKFLINFVEISERNFPLGSLKYGKITVALF
jgi:hypothetical protein